MVLTGLRESQCPRFFTVKFKDMNQTLPSVFKSIIDDDVSVIVVIGNGSSKFYKLHQNHLKTLNFSVTDKRIFILLDFSSTIELDYPFKLRSRLEHVITLKKTNNNQQFFDTFLHTLNTTRKEYGRTLVTGYNCMAAFENLILSSLQLIQIYNYPLNLFQYTTFQRFKSSMVKRASNKKNELRVTRSELVEASAKDKSYKFKRHRHRFLDCDSNNRYRLPSCRIPTCGLGKENIFGRLHKEKGIWGNNSYGWSCRQCPLNYFQSNDTALKTSCWPCPGFSLSTQNRDSCYNIPYSDRFLSIYNQVGLKLACGVCIIGFMMCCFAMVVLVTKRYTPVVRGSNFPIMILHATSMLLLFLVIPLPYIGLKMSKPTCLLELLVTSLLVFSPYTLILIKCQNLLLAFNSKIRLSR
eukprot:TCONS_00052871-protein